MSELASCAICAKHRGEGPLGGLRVWSDAHVVVFHAPAPELGHLFVETHRHAPHLADLTDDEVAAVGRATARLARGLAARPRVAAVHTAVAGLAVAHFHQHVFVRAAGTPASVPWHASDTWDGALRGGDDDIARLCQQMQSALDTS